MQTDGQREEIEHLVRALSHDMRASFMLLEHSFDRLKRSLDRPAAEGRLRADGAHEGLADRVAHVDACLRQARNLLDDLVQLARTGMVEMEPARVELAAVVDQVLFEQREVLAGRGVRVSLEGPLPALWCNQSRLKQLVTNLVRNAALHGCDRRQPQITIGPAVVDPDQHGGAAARMAAFRIHDNGAGIDPGCREDIFLPGRRLAGANAEGSGMGLAIVRKIVEHYGGRVYVDPAYRSGTAMVVALPASQPQTAPSPRESKPHELRPHLPGAWGLALPGTVRPSPLSPGATGGG